MFQEIEEAAKNDLGEDPKNLQAQILKDYLDLMISLQSQSITLNFKT